MIRGMLQEAILAWRHIGRDRETGRLEQRFAAGRKRGRPAIQIASKRHELHGLTALDGPREHVLHVRPVADRQPVRKAAAIGQVVQHGDVVAVGGCDEIDQWVAAVIVAARGQLFPRGAEHSSCESSSESSFCASTSKTIRCPLLAGKRKQINILAVGRAVDRRS